MVLNAGCVSGDRLSPDGGQCSIGARSVDLIPGTWDRVAGLSPDRALAVMLLDGTRLDGAFRALRPDALDLTPFPVDHSTDPCCR